MDFLFRTTPPIVTSTGNDANMNHSSNLQPTQKSPTQPELPLDLTTGSKTEIPIVQSSPIVLPTQSNIA